MAAPLPPVDTSVSLPPSVLRAAEAANAAHGKAYGVAAEPPQPAAIEPTSSDAGTPEPAAPQPDPVAVQSQPEPVATQGPVEPAEWEHRYNSMKGRFDQSQRTVGSMQQQLSELGDELIRTQQLIAQPRQQQQPNTPPQPVRVLTDEDRATYGPELIDVIQRAAVEAVAPEINQVRQQNRNIAQRVATQTQQGVYQTLGAEIPNWSDINNSPRFKAWCRLPDLYSGVVRGKLLMDAFQAANAARVVAFFRGFLAEEVATGQQPDPSEQQPQQDAPARVPAIPLETLAAPGRAKPATGNTPAPADKPIYTRAQVAGFYDDVRKGVYAGRDEDKKRDEALIFAAQREGRIR